MAMDPFRFSLDTGAPTPADLLPPGARQGLGGVAAANTTTEPPSYQQGVPSPGGDVWYPGFGQYATIKHGAPSDDGGGDNGTGGDNGGTNPPPAPATFTRTQIETAVRNALAARGFQGNRLDRSSDLILNRLFRQSSTTSLTLAQMEPILQRVTEDALGRQVSGADIFTAISTSLTSTSAGTGAGANTTATASATVPASAATTQQATTQQQAAAAMAAPVEGQSPADHTGTQGISYGPTDQGMATPEVPSGLAQVGLGIIGQMAPGGLGFPIGLGIGFNKASQQAMVAQAVSQAKGAPVSATSAIISALGRQLLPSLPSLATTSQTTGQLITNALIAAGVPAAAAPGMAANFIATGNIHTPSATGSGQTDAGGQMGGGQNAPIGPQQGGGDGAGQGGDRGQDRRGAPSVGGGGASRAPGSAPGQSGASPPPSPGAGLQGVGVQNASLPAGSVIGMPGATGSVTGGSLGGGGAGTGTGGLSGGGATGGGGSGLGGVGTGESGNGGLQTGGIGGFGDTSSSGEGDAGGGSGESAGSDGGSGDTGAGSAGPGGETDSSAGGTGPGGDTSGEASSGSGSSSGGGGSSGGGSSSSGSGDTGAGTAGPGGEADGSAGGTGTGDTGAGTAGPGGEADSSAGGTGSGDTGAGSAGPGGETDGSAGGTGSDPSGGGDPGSSDPGGSDPGGTGGAVAFRGGYLPTQSLGRLSAGPPYPRMGLSAVGAADYAQGGMVDARALGAPNPPGPDDGYAFLDGGEFVVRAQEVPKYLGTLQAINEGRHPPDAGAGQSFAHGGLVPPMEGGMDPMMMGGHGAAQPMPDEMFEDEYGGYPGEYDVSGAGQPSPLMPPDGAGVVTADTAMMRASALPPDIRQAMAMSLADPNVMGAWAAMLGPSFSPVLTMMAGGGQQQGGGMDMMGGAPPGAGAPPMGMGGVGMDMAPPAPQGGNMGGFSGGGLVHPMLGSRANQPAMAGNGAPRGVRPSWAPPKREPAPFQPPRRGMGGVGMRM